MTRRDLVESIQKQLVAAGGPELSRQALGMVIDAVFAGVTEGLRETGRYVHPGFGTFAVQVTQAHPGRNPRTGEAIEIPRAETVRFKASPELKSAIER